MSLGKERAIESLLYSGSHFVLNILAEGNYQGIMRHFLKTFGPGEDRFAGVTTEDAENGCPILTDALAYLECTVQNRMECGDHWLIYAVVDNGKVLQPNSITAVHQRKSGSYYAGV
jgi:flavin reductase (DIM6/NTAB) family NADH-FMN oxidoreductase RutF